MSWLKDLFRGYSDKDIVSACRNVVDVENGAKSKFTHRSWEAYKMKGITLEYAQRILKSAETIEKLK